MVTINLTDNELDDLRRALVVAMQLLDDVGDTNISDRLELLKDRLDHLVK